jgi:hypothetical protein
MSLLKTSQIVAVEKKKNKKQADSFFRQKQVKAWERRSPERQDA